MKRCAIGKETHRDQGYGKIGSANPGNGRANANSMELRFAWFNMNGEMAQRRVLRRKVDIQNKRWTEEAAKTNGCG